MSAGGSSTNREENVPSSNPTEESPLQYVLNEDSAFLDSARAVLRREQINGSQLQSPFDPPNLDRKYYEEAKVWLSKMRLSMLAYNITDAEAINLIIIWTGGALKERLYEWAKQQRSINEPTIFARFEYEFLSAFYVEENKYKALIQMFKIEQGNKSVESFNDEFMRWKGSMAFTLDEEFFLLIYIMKLKPHIKNFLIGREVNSLMQAMNASRDFEEASELAYQSNFQSDKKKDEKKQNDTQNKFSGSKRKCFNCGGTDHEFKTCKNPTKCYNCNKSGHRSTDCPEPKKASTTK